ncbi:B-cell receptor CD22-like [Epinephelus lanceolatus]
MSLTAAARGFVVFLLSVSVIQGQDDWGVTYTSTEICAVKGSTVEIHCSYRYPSRINGPDTKVEKAFWFIEKKNVANVYLKDDPQYLGRVQYDRDEIKTDCTLRITDLRESDSAVYKFRFITNHPNAYTGEPGVTLSVADLDLKVSRSSSSSSLQCHSSRYLPDHTSYIWYKNGQKIKEGTSPYVDFSSDSADSYSCAVKGCENFPSPSVYAPKLPSVSVSPSAEIVEGSSVNLTCSSDANPAAKYTWYKEDEDSPKASGQIFTISNVTAEHSGNYYCEAQNTRGRHNSTLHLTVVAGPVRGR